MKVAVIGAGAVGTMIGGLIKHHCPDLELVLLARGPHGDEMRRTGRVVLQGPWGSRVVPLRASEDPQEVAGADFALFTVKSRDTDSAAWATRDHVGEAPVISIQNGINQDVLARHFSSRRLIVGTTATNTAIADPGTVHLHRDGLTVIGPATAETETRVVDRALELLARSGLAVKSEANILGAQYNKLLVNTVGYASVLSASNILTDCLLHGAWRREVATPLLAEGFAVVRHSGIRLARTGGLADVVRFRRLVRLLNLGPVEPAARFVFRHIVKPKRIVYSVYQDLIRGRPTEIDFVNGRIVNLADRCAIASPYNRLVVEMVRSIEEHGAGAFFAREEVIERFRQVRTSG